MQSINPYNGKVNADIPEDSAATVKIKLKKAEKAFTDWKNGTFAERGKLFKKLADILLSEKERHARLITEEMGKLFPDSVAEIEKCAWVCNYYADQAEKMLANEFISTHPTVSQVHFEPMGVVLAVMPWNFPYWQVFRFAAPTLMAGNTGVLKHASNVPMCAVEIENIFLRAGFPEGVFQSLLIPSKAVPSVIRNKVIRAVTLTGSEDAGKKVASLAAKNIKKSVLELGGSDAFIVMKDADVREAAQNAVTARMLCGGQSCIAAKRFIIHEDVAEEFTDILVERLKTLSAGDPMDMATTQPPLARPDLAAELNMQVEKLKSEHASMVYQSFPYDPVRSFYPLTVFTGVKSSSVAYKEELFGPVFCITTFKTDKQAIDLANHTTFGLGACIWSRQAQHAYKLAAQVEAGNVYVNNIVRSDVRLPFGGVKRSGYGRELGEFGIREFVNVKSLHGK